VLAIQPNPDRNDLFEPLMPLLDGVTLVHTAGLRADALRLAREIREEGPLASLAIDALILLMMVRAARLEVRQRYYGRPPAWLTRSRDALHDSFARPPRIDELAALAGVSASHLAHSFRKHFQATPGEYVRHVRVQWAMEQLATTDRDISEIALAAGYSDQSHFTRELQRTCGVSPRAYRVSARASRSRN
jgi:AraC family transcriptional regulator